MEAILVFRIHNRLICVLFMLRWPSIIF